MQAFRTLQSVVAPLDRANVDTDALIPKQFMKSIQRTGFGDNLFDEWRYLDRGYPGQDVSDRRRNPDFVLNQPQYESSRILLARENFGCGSSREHAVWALADFGIRVILAPSFADIFFGNCFKNGLLPVELPALTIDRLFREVDSTPGLSLSVDLFSQTLVPSLGEPIRFDVDPSRKQRLLEGLDDIGLTLQRADSIRAFEIRHRAAAPWFFQ